MSSPATPSNDRAASGPGSRSTADMLGTLPPGGSLSLQGQTLLLFPSLRNRRSSMPNSMRSEKSLRSKGTTTNSTKGRRQSVQTDAEIMAMSVLGLPPVLIPGDSPRTSIDGGPVPGATPAAAVAAAASAAALAASGGSSSSSTGVTGSASGTGTLSSTSATSPAVAAYLGTLTAGVAQHPSVAAALAAGGTGHRRSHSGGSSTAGPAGVGAGSAAATPPLQPGVVPVEPPEPVALFLAYVRVVLHVLKPLRRTWVLSNMLYILFQALEQLPRHGRADRTAGILQKAALAVPEGMPLLKTVILARCLRYSPVPTNRKTIVDRRKLLDNTLGLARQIGLTREEALLSEMATSLDATAAGKDKK
jgi:hypothetical protein